MKTRPNFSPAGHRYVGRSMKVVEAQAIWLDALPTGQ